MVDGCSICRPIHRHIYYRPWKVHSLVHILRGIPLAQYSQRCCRLDHHLPEVGQCMAHHMVDLQHVIFHYNIIYQTAIYHLGNFDHDKSIITWWLPLNTILIFQSSAWDIRFGIKLELLASSHLLDRWADVKSSILAQTSRCVLESNWQCVKGWIRADNSQRRDEVSNNSGSLSDETVADDGLPSVRWLLVKDNQATRRSLMIAQQLTKQLLMAALRAIRWLMMINPKRRENRFLTEM